MNELTPTQNSTPARPTTPALSPELTTLLDDAGSPDVAVAKIVGDAALLAEVRSAIPALKAVSEAKAGKEGVKAVVGRRLAMFPQPSRSEGEWAAWWADYFDVLEDLSLASLEAGMRAYIARPDSEFMPKPGKLRELAFSAPCRTHSRFYRAIMAVKKADEPVGMVVTDRVNPKDVRKLMEEFRSGMAARSPEPKPRPYTGGIPDEGGITRQMREVIARRQAMGR